MLFSVYLKVEYFPLPVMEVWVGDDSQVGYEFDHVIFLVLSLVKQPLYHIQYGLVPKEINRYTRNYLALRVYKQKFSIIGREFGFEQFALKKFYHFGFLHLVGSQQLT